VPDGIDPVSGSSGPARQPSYAVPAPNSFNPEYDYHDVVQTQVQAGNAVKAGALAASYGTAVPNTGPAPAARYGAAVPRYGQAMPRPTSDSRPEPHHTTAAPLTSANPSGAEYAATLAPLQSHVVYGSSATLGSAAPGRAPPNYDYHDRVEPAEPGGVVYARPVPLPIAESADVAVTRSPSGYELGSPPHMRAPQPAGGHNSAVPISDEGYSMPDFAAIGLGGGTAAASTRAAATGTQHSAGTALQPGSTDSTGNPAGARKGRIRRDADNRKPSIYLGFETTNEEC